MFTKLMASEIVAKVQSQHDTGATRSYPPTLRPRLVNLALPMAIMLAQVWAITKYGKRGYRAKGASKKTPKHRRRIGRAMLPTNDHQRIERQPAQKCAGCFFASAPAATSLLWPELPKQMKAIAMTPVCDREAVLPLMQLFAKSLRPMMTLRDAARIKLWDGLIERVEYDVELLALALKAVEELARVVESNGIAAAKEVAKAKVVLAKR